MRMESLNPGAEMVLLLGAWLCGMRLINWKSLPGWLGKQASRRQLPVLSLLSFLGPL